MATTSHTPKTPAAPSAPATSPANKGPSDQPAPAADKVVVAPAPADEPAVKEAHKANPDAPVNFGHETAHESTKPDPKPAPKATPVADREYVVTYDVFTFLRPKVSKPGEFDHFRAFAGDRVKVDAKTAARAIALGAIAEVADAPAVRKAVESLAGPVADDRQLATMSAPELIAYVTQNPGEASRVYHFEAGNQGRPNVLKATGMQFDEAGVSVATGTGVQHSG